MGAKQLVNGDRGPEIDMLYATALLMVTFPGPNGSVKMMLIKISCWRLTGSYSPGRETSVINWVGWVRRKMDGFCNLSVSTTATSKGPGAYTDHSC